MTATGEPYVSRPGSLRIERHGAGGIRVSWRPRGPLHLAAGVVAPVLAITAWGLVELSDAYLLAAACGVAAAALGAWLLLAVVNLTTIEADERGLRAWRTPFPWPPPVDLEARDVAGVYAETDLIGASLHALCRGRGGVIVATGLDRPEEAGHLAQEIRRALGRKAPSPEGDVASPPSPEREVASAAEGVEVDAEGGELVLRRRWDRSMGFLATGVPVIGAYLILGHQAGGRGVELVMHLAILVPFGLGMLYTGLAYLLNEETIAIARGELSIRHGPLPWPAPRPVRTTDIAQLFTVERRYRHRHSSHVSFAYDVHVVRADGADLCLLWSLVGKDAALLIERAIEKHLGIRDRPIQGELPRP